MTTLNEIAQRYGHTVNDAGQICKNGAPSGVTARMVKCRLQCRAEASGMLLFTGQGEEALARFLERFWYLEPVTGECTAMTTNQHTPGPWSQSATCSSDLYNIRNISGADCEHVAVINYKLGMTQAEALANARLITAAPELLDALEYVVRIAEAKQAGTWDDVMKYRELLNRILGGKP